MARLTTVLVVNAGSSSLKLQRIAPGDEVEAEAELEQWDGSDAAGAFQEVLDGATEVGAVGHRVVHGGTDLAEPVIIDDEVEAQLEQLRSLAPLHQPRSLAGIRAARRALPHVPHVACFDTAFHRSLSPAARTYALPAEWRKRWSLERFGFHGLSHAWAARRAPQIARTRAVRRLVTCHLGAGASLCAVLDGRSVDTTMGFTPLEGLVMATRSGSVDPGLVLWLQTEAGLDASEVREGLERRAGLAGLSGTSGDMRQILAGRAAGNDAAALAFEVYVRALRREISAMVAALGGLDLLAFTGGVGEHAAPVRECAVAGLAYLSLALDPTANAAASSDADVSAAGCSAATVVVTSREDLEIAGQVRGLLG